MKIRMRVDCGNSKLQELVDFLKSIEDGGACMIYHEGDLVGESLCYDDVSSKLNWLRIAKYDNMLVPRGIFEDAKIIIGWEKWR